MWDDVDPEHPFAAEVQARFPEECGDCGTDELCERCWVNVVKPRLDAMERRCAPYISPPPQPATTRLAAEADEAEQRYVAQRERAERAEEEARALRAQVRDLEEARGELLETIKPRRKPDPNAKPDPECENCNGRGCMGCVFREWGHVCADDCPHCCPWVLA